MPISESARALRKSQRHPANAGLHYYVYSTDHDHATGGNRAELAEASRLLLA
jgi:hypothetical protein